MKLKELLGTERECEVTSMKAFALKLDPEIELVEEEFLGRISWKLPKAVIDRYENLRMAKTRAGEFFGCTTGWHKRASLGAAISFAQNAGIGQNLSMQGDWASTAREIISRVNAQFKGEAAG